MIEENSFFAGGSSENPESGVNPKKESICAKLFKEGSVELEKTNNVEIYWNGKKIEFEEAKEQWKQHNES